MRVGEALLRRNPPTHPQSSGNVVPSVLRRSSSAGQGPQKCTRRVRHAERPPAKDGDLSNWLGKRAATCRALGSLPFRTADEPLMVVRACARACALDGAALHESLRDSSDISARDAARCGAFSLLCRLKAHIKRRHRLGDARCAAYDGDCDKQRRSRRCTVNLRAALLAQCAGGRRDE